MSYLANAKERVKRFAVRSSFYLMAMALLAVLALFLTAQIPAWSGNQQQLASVAQFSVLPDWVRSRAVDSLTDNALLFDVFLETPSDSIGEHALMAMDSDTPLVNYLIFKRGKGVYDRVSRRILEEISNQHRLGYLYTQVENTNLCEGIIKKIDDEIVLFDLMNISFITDGKVRLIKYRMSLL